MVGWFALARDFMPWHRSQGRTALETGRPWVTFEAMRLLERRVRPDSRVFEYGSGGSTVFLGRRAGQVVSVEHDPAWYATVREAVSAIPSVELVLAEPRPPRHPDEAAFASTSPGLETMTFIDYVKVVDRYPEHHFDLLIVDGRARPSAFFRAESKVRVGGIVLLDDSERSRYRPAIETARRAGWIEHGRLGPKPFTPLFARTTVWTKTGDLASATSRLA
jgi:hypothetical protein